VLYHVSSGLANEKLRYFEIMEQSVGLYVWDIFFFEFCRCGGEAGATPIVKTTPQSLLLFRSVCMVVSKIRPDQISLILTRYLIECFLIESLKSRHSRYIDRVDTCQKVQKVDRHTFGGFQAINYKCSEVMIVISAFLMIPRLVPTKFPYVQLPRIKYVLDFLHIFSSIVQLRCRITWSPNQFC
jgi:hypothetical protein